MAIHIEKIKNKGKQKINFLSWERQNQLIDSVASSIKEVINKQLRESRFFSVGLQALVCADNPAAVYTWCYAHRLSLIVVQGSCSSQNAVDLFGNLESLYTLISSSKKRVFWFDNAQKKHYPMQ